MRVCLVSREVAPYRGGGIGTYIALAARALVEAGHEVHLLTEAHPQLSDGTRLGTGEHVHFVGVSGNTALPGFLSEQARYALAVHETLTRLHADRPFDVVEFPEYWGEGYFACRAKRWQRAYAEAKVVVRLHTPSRDVRELNRQFSVDAAGAEVDHLEAGFDRCGGPGAVADALSA